MSVQTASITQRLDQAPLGRFHWKLVTLSGLGWMFDAMDIGILAFVVARLSRDWQLTSWDVGWLLAIGGLGMLCGAALSGWLADRFGRRTMFQWTLLTYSIATGLSALVPDGALWLLLILRFIVGMGVGGELPVASTLVSEFAPAQHRGRLLVILESFWAYGWIAAALVGYFLIEAFGWRAAFAVGALPALYVFVLRQGMPESPRFLVAQGRHEEAERVLRLIEGAQSRPIAAPATAEPKLPVIRATNETIWDFPRRTMMLWILWFGMVFSYYGIFGWLPSILANISGNYTRGFEFVLWITLAQVPGYFSAAFLVERWGRKPTLALYLFACAVTALLFGQSQALAGLFGGGDGGLRTNLLLWGCLMSFFNLGAWGVIYTYTPELYPTRIRGVGAGVAAAVGRAGGVLGPLVVPYMLTDLKVGPEGVFAMFALVLLIIAINVGTLGEETKGRTLEEIENLAPDTARSAGAADAAQRPVT